MSDDRVWTKAQLAYKPSWHPDDGVVDDPLTEIDTTIRRARSGDLQALGGMLSPTRPEFEPEPNPPEAPWIPAHQRLRQQQEQAQQRQQYGVQSRLVQRRAPLVFKAVANANLDGKDFVCSTGDRDRYGDELVQAGWVLDAYRKNPVALFGHFHDWAIGTWEDLRVEGGALRARLKLAPAGISSRVDEIRGLIGAKVLRAVSVGFLPLESEPIGNGSVRFGKMELAEISIVAVPANSAALAVD